eukprot:scaffold4286_cov92-Amphora_coffeaeformis.AAC.7
MSYRSLIESDASLTELVKVLKHHYLSNAGTNAHETREYISGYAIHRVYEDSESIGQTTLPYRF